MEIIYLKKITEYEQKTYIIKIKSIKQLFIIWKTIRDKMSTMYL